jgi:hypothetical protein
MNKVLAILAVVFAFATTGTSAASASVFTSTGGPIEGVSTTTQVFTFNGLSVECNAARSAGTVAAMTLSELRLDQAFSQCKAVFGISKVNMEISLAEVGLTANQTLGFLNTVTINIPLVSCHLTIAPQGPLSSLALSSWPVAVSSISGITYTSSGGLCGASGTNGTFSGTTEYHGSVSRDP